MVDCVCDFMEIQWVFCLLKFRSINGGILLMLEFDFMDLELLVECRFEWKPAVSGALSSTINWCCICFEKLIFQNELPIELQSRLALIRIRGRN